MLPPGRVAVRAGRRREPDRARRSSGAAILRANRTSIEPLRVKIAYTLHQAPFDESLLHEVTQLAREVFGDASLDVAWRLGVMPNATAVLARDVAGRLVGFKLGYAMTESKYYSWLGGVHVAARGGGVARQLMRRQHRWLAECGCRLVETSTDQGNLAMARVNLQEGFRVCGRRSSPGRVKVLYLKSLAPPPRT